MYNGVKGEGLKVKSGVYHTHRAKLISSAGVSTDRPLDMRYFCNEPWRETTNITTLLSITLNISSPF